MMDAGKFRAVAAMAIAVALAGCQGMGSQQRPGGGTVTPPPSSGIDGEWLSTDGTSLSRFSGGQFETIAADTGNRLAEGTYAMTDAANVSITMTSLIRQTTLQVNCFRVTQTQLNCTSAAGQQFSLVRRA